jgi:MarR family transcriptional regulator, organic hydroperoxide resistance regulator
VRRLSTDSVANDRKVRTPSPAPGRPRGAANTPSVAELAELIRVLSETERNVTHALCEVLAAERATVAQWHVLSLLADEATHPMTQIADSTLLTAPTATRLIDAMVRDGLVQRANDDADRRRVLVRITPHGRSRHRRLSARVRRHRAAILAGADLVRLRRIVERLTAAER